MLFPQTAPMTSLSRGDGPTLFSASNSFYSSASSGGNRTFFSLPSSTDGSPLFYSPLSSVQFLGDDSVSGEKERDRAYTTFFLQEKKPLFVIALVKIRRKDR